MRIVVVDTYYDAFLRSHYAADPDLADAPYDEQHAALMARLFGTSDFYSRHFRALGHDAVEVVANCLPLQRRWARDHGGRAALPGYLPERVLVRALRRLLLRQIELLKPDVIYVQDISWVGPIAPALREHTRLLVGQHASTPPSAELIAPYDLMVSCAPNLVQRYRADGADAAYVPLAFEPEIVDRLPHTAPATEVVHVGGYGPIHASATSCWSVSPPACRSTFWGYAVEGLGADFADPPRLPGGGVGGRHVRRPCRGAHHADEAHRGRRGHARERTRRSSRRRALAAASSSTSAPTSGSCSSPELKS